MQNRAITDEVAVVATGWEAFQEKATDQAVVKKSNEPTKRSRSDKPIKQIAHRPGAKSAPIQNPAGGQDKPIKAPETAATSNFFLKSAVERVRAIVFIVFDCTKEAR